MHLCKMCIKTSKAHMKYMCDEINDSSQITIIVHRTHHSIQVRYSWCATNKTFVCRSAWNHSVEPPPPSLLHQQHLCSRNGHSKTGCWKELSLLKYQYFSTLELWLLAMAWRVIHLQHMVIVAIAISAVPSSPPQNPFAAPLLRLAESACLDADGIMAQS